MTSKPLAKASWAVAREETDVLAWDAITLADIGRFPTVAAALADLPGVDKVTVPTARALRCADIIPMRRMALAG